MYKGSNVQNKSQGRRSEPGAVARSRPGIVPDHVIPCLVSRRGEQAKFNLAARSRVVKGYRLGQYHSFLC